MARQFELFESERARDRRVLVGVLNDALDHARGRPPRTLWPLPDFTVPGLDPLTGRRV